MQKYVLWANKWCSTILWYYPRCLLHSWSHIVALWATIATRLWAKMAKNSWKLDFEDTYLHNLLFYIQICSMGNKWCSAILSYHPRCLLHSRPHLVNLWATIATREQKWPKMVQNSFLTKIPTITSYSTHKYVLWANEWCSIIPWYCPRYLLHLWPHINTLWATIATPLWAKMAKNGWKLDFGYFYLHSLLF
jgi:hypothetical protein